MNYTTLSSKSDIEKTIAALKKNGMHAILVENGAEAHKKVLESIPKGAEVMTMTSATLDAIGIPHEINEYGHYDSLRSKLNKMDRETQSVEMQKLGAAPAYAIGSVHAVTHDGEVFIASNTGSQLPAYAYSAGKVIWVIGAQKIVKNKEEALKRIYEHTLPLESERAHKAYGVPGSFVSKLLIINKEITPDRINIIFVNEVLGF